MKKKILWIIIIALAIVVVYNTYDIKTSKDQDWKEGDLIFQISTSQQSPLIQVATLSPWSHCGIVVEKNGEFYVLEASNVVKLTPINDWINRGRFGIFKTRRVLEEDVKIKYSKYLGQPYDLQFKFDNGKMYCSELIWVVYKEQFDIELSKPKQIKSYLIFGFEGQMKKRNMDPEEYAVAPCDLL